jgi:hypothetical protein
MYMYTHLINYIKTDVSINEILKCIQYVCISMNIFTYVMHCMHINN